MGTPQLAADSNNDVEDVSDLTSSLLAPPHRYFAQYMEVDTRFRHHRVPSGRKNAADCNRSNNNNYKMETTIKKKMTTFLMKNLLPTPLPLLLMKTTKPVLLHPPPQLLLLLPPPSPFLLIKTSPL